MSTLTKKTLNALLLSLFVIATLACYLPHVTGSLVGLDTTSYDPILLTPRPWQTAWKVLVDFKGTIVQGYYAPLGSLSLILDRVLAGSVQAAPKVTFVVNLLLHCLNGLLLWRLLRSLGFGEAVALASVFVFLIHPMQVPVVAWFAERKTVLSVTFYLLCYVLFVRAGFGRWTVSDSPDSDILPPGHTPEHDRALAGPWRNGIVFYFMSLAAFVLGLLTKPTVSVFPVVWMWGAAFNFDRDPAINSRLSFSTVRRFVAAMWAALVPLLPFLATAVLIGSVAYVSEPPIRAPLAIFQRVPLVGATILFYLHKAIAPVDLMYVYPKWDLDPYSLWWWLPLIGVSAGLILLFRYRRHFAQSFTWGVGNFLIPLLPAAGVVNFGYFQLSYVANHFAYLSMAGAAACVGSVFISGMRRSSPALKRIIIVFAVIYSAFLVGQTWLQASIWQTPLTLWEDNVSRCPSCPTAQSGLGVVFVNSGRYQEGLAHLEAAVAGRPDSAIDYSNIAQVKVYTKDFRGAMPYYLKAIELKPSYAKAHNGLGLVYQALGDKERGIAEFQRAVDLAPHLVEAQYNLAVAEQQAGATSEAIAHYKEVLLLNPQHFAAHNNIGYAYLSLGQLGKAKTHFEKALDIRPDAVYALKNLQRVQEEIRKRQPPAAVKPPKGTDPSAPSPP